jgi:hypothetical protein
MSGRPTGEVRVALRQAAQAMVSERAQLGLQPVAVTYRDLAQRAQVGFGAAKETVRNMARAGELVAAGTVPTKHARRPLQAYVPRQQGDTWNAVTALDGVMRAWR